jgi:hypothetical protein
MDKIGRTSRPYWRTVRVWAVLAADDDCRSTRENESGAKTKTSGAKANAFLCDDDAKSSTRDSGERGDKYRSRQATWRQSQADRQMEGA